MLVPALVRRTDKFRWTSRVLDCSPCDGANESPNKNAI